jgi:hypothetical protein
MTDHFTNSEDFGGDMACCLVKTSCVAPLRLLANALWLMLTERVKRLVERMETQLLSALVLLQTFRQWITRENDDQP